MEFLLQRHQESARSLVEEIRESLFLLEQDCCIRYCYQADENVTDVISRAQLMKNSNLFSSKKILNSVIKHLKDTKIEEPDYIFQCQIELLSICNLQGPLETAVDFAHNIIHQCKHCSTWNRFLFQAYMLLGEAYHARGNTSDAINYYNCAKEIALSHSDQMDAEVHVLWCQHLLNENSGVIDKLNQILCTSIHQSVKGTLLYVLGCIYRVLTRFELAEEMLQMACQVFSDLGNKIKLDMCQSELSRIYRATGDSSKALELQKELYLSALRRGDFANLVMSCSLLGFTYQYYKQNNLSSPDMDLSVQYLAVGMHLSIQFGAKDNVGWCLNNIAKAYIKSKHFQEALQLCKMRMAIAKETGNSTGEGTAYGNAGLACRGLTEYNQAVEYHKSYLKMVGERYLDKAWMEHELALDYMLLGDYESAVNYALQELSTNSTIQSHYNTTSTSDKSKVANFEKNQARCFNLLQYLFVQMGNYDAALAYADIGRASSISDMFSSKHNLVSGYYSLTNHTKRLDGNFLKHSVHTFHEIVNRLHAALVFYSLVNHPIEIESKETTQLYIWVILPEISVIHFSQKCLKSLDTSLFSVLRGKEYQYFQHASCVPSEPQRDLVLNDDACTSGEDSANHCPCSSSFDTELEMLYNILIQPIDYHLFSMSCRKIIFVPHKSLITVPFSSLKNADKCSLVSYFSVSISLSIYLLQLTVQVISKRLGQESDDKVLVVGNPSMPSMSFVPLPGSEKEALYVAGLLGKSKQIVMLCGAAATKNEVIAHLERSTIVHLATHAFEANPSSSASATSNVAYSDYSTKGTIILAKSNEGCSGMLTSTEVQNMTIPAELVVLSCCKTAQGKVTSEGTLGLSRAFISAGSGAVLVTLWSIPDLHTVELMKKFYTFYARSHDAASALQQAMIYMNTELHLGFGYWGAFCLIGITPGFLI